MRVGVTEGEFDRQALKHLCLRLHVETFALRLTLVVDIPVTAEGNADRRLYVIPFCVIDAGGDLQAAVEHVVLGADLVALRRVRLVGGRGASDTELLEAGGAGCVRDERIY